MNELLYDLEQYQKTGDIPPSNEFLIKKVSNAIKNTRKLKYRHFKANLGAMSREQLESILDDISGYRHLPSYKLNQLQTI